MFKLSELYGKHIVALDGSAAEGKISAAFFDGRLQKLDFLQTDAKETFAADIFANNDAVCLNQIKTADAAGISNPIGKKVFDTTGAYKGVLTDIILGTGGKCKKVISGEDTFSLSKIYAASDVVLLRAKLPCEQKKHKPAAKSVKYVPKRLSGDFSFLLGRKVDKTIVNFQGEIMIRKGASVTKEILKSARISGKLIELTLHAK